MRTWSKAENRLAAYSFIVLCVYVFVFSYYTTIDLSSRDKLESPFGVDFAVYYTAGQMVTTGNLDNIYNVQEHHAALEEVLNRKIPFNLSWVYPPTFLLAIVPFSYFSYYLALALWLIITFTLAVYSVYLTLPNHKSIALLICGFPGVLMNLRWGQNGFLNTAILGFGIYFVESNPIMSGLMFGLMTYKPQLAFFPLLFLLLTKKWKVLRWAILFSTITALASVIIFGYSIWINFINVFVHTSSALLTSVWETTAAIQPTLYSAFRIWGLKGYALQITMLIIAIIATLCLLWVWKKTNRFSIKGSVLIIGIFLTMPYYVQYDLMVLSIPLVLIAYDFLEYGYRPCELLILITLWLLPLVNWPFVLLTGIQICPFILMIVMIMLSLRVKNQITIDQIEYKVYQ